MTGFLSGFISIIGSPNVGKSTLMNRFVGQKVSIVSARAQTTRNRVMGVLTKPAYQIVFLDTPGVTTPKNRLGEYMLKVAYDSLNEVEAVLFLVDAEKGIREKDEALLEKLASAKAPVIAAINKIDAVEKEKLLEVIAVYSEKASFDAIVPISAKTGDGVEDLLSVCEKYAVEGPFLFPEDVTTDQPERQVMAEIIREKLLWCLDREVPHGTAVEITKFSERDNGIIDIDATIYCEKASHKGIIIGKRGEMLKKISTMARADCEKFMGTKVYLTTWVKVKENWRDSDFLVRNFGYTE